MVSRLSLPFGVRKNNVTNRYPSNARNVSHYYTDFSEYSVGAAPGDWSLGWLSGYGEMVIDRRSGYGGRRLTLTMNPEAVIQNPCAYLWDAPQDVRDVEVLCRIKGWVAFLGGSATISLVARTIDYRSLLFYIAPHTGTNWMGLFWLEGTDIEETFTDLDTLDDATKTMFPDVWYWVRYRLHGTKIQCRLWGGSIDDEPATWDMEAETQDFLDIGSVGFMLFGSKRMACDYFAVATNGGTALGPADGPGSSLVTVSTTTTTSTTT